METFSGAYPGFLGVYCPETVEKQFKLTDLDVKFIQKRSDPLILILLDGRIPFSEKFYL